MVSRIQFIYILINCYKKKHGDRYVYIHMMMTMMAMMMMMMMMMMMIIPLHKYTMIITILVVLLFSTVHLLMASPGTRPKELTSSV